ncbi:IPT/TIG domain-containing protein [Sphingobacterium chungjuense]|uniref:IPT/TIG domain-containing protein n=1 Tax=Sphingobacterium chungjuense TaxID=2675553 RepID=UPI001408D35E|nr:IPT/TIG domain-containing protein [Sphingobacterium chungjuense]
MKNLKSILNSTLFMLLLVIACASCEKDLDGTPQTSPGNLQIERIEPDSASGGAVLIVKGQGLGQISSVIFERDSVPATFNQVFNTDEALVFRVPDTASGGIQNIIFTNTRGDVGKATFRVIAVPSVLSVSSTDVTAGMELTMTGINLEDVSRVSLDSTDIDAEIISTSKKELIVRLPATSRPRVRLAILNSSGSSVTTQEFVYIENNYQIFGESMNTNINNSSWSASLTNNSDPAYVRFGNTSLKAEYTGSWGGLQLAMNTPVNLNPYRYVTFWVKGASVATNISFNFNWENTQTLAIPANTWKYFKIDLQTFKGAGVVNLETFVMQINGDPHTLYLDNILLVK